VRNGQSIFSRIDQQWRDLQEPIVNPINEGWWLDTHNQAADAGAGVLLTGETGNMTISFGGLQVLPHWIRRLQFLTWFREMRSAVASNDVRWRGALMSSFRPFMPQLLSDALEHKFQAVPARLETLFARPEWATGDAESDWVMTGDPSKDRVANLNRLDGGLQRKGLLGRCRIDDRDPTGDRRLAEFALSLRPEHQLSQGVSKPLARRALADRLPAKILDLQTRGYQGADWFGRFDTKRAIEILEDIECSSTASALLDTGRLRKALLAWPKFDPVRCVGLYWMGRSVAHALSVGAFISETERNPELIGS
jgi:asparagine synthase (glutamine-hydrolysing)